MHVHVCFAAAGRTKDVACTLRVTQGETKLCALGSIVNHIYGRGMGP